MYSLHSLKKKKTGLNRDININDSENNSIVTNNVMNSSICENRVNLNSFLK